MGRNSNGPSYVRVEEGREGARSGCRSLKNMDIRSAKFACSNVALDAGW